MKADGIIHPKEEEYMNQIYSRFSVKISDLDEISNFDDLLAKNVVNEMTVEKKMKAKNIFLGMAKADDYIHPKEIETINNIFS